MSASSVRHVMVADRQKRKWAILVGIGLAIMPIHNQRLTELVTQNGEVGFFIPAFGWLILLLASGWYLTYSKEKLVWGSGKVLIPLLVIVGVLVASSFAHMWQIAFAGALLFIVYLATLRLGKLVFLPLAIGAMVASAGIIAFKVLNPEVRTTGGFIFEGNYDIATGYILAGIVLYPCRYRWLLALFGSTALLLSGSPEAYFAMVVLGIWLVATGRMDVGTAILAGITAIVGASVLGYGEYTLEIVKGNTNALSLRWDTIVTAMTNLKPVGDGYNLTGFTPATVHNVPLVIVQQLGYGGIIASLAWLWISAWCLVKTKMKTAWVLVFALSVFDHFIWTQLAPLWWMLIGVSLNDNE